MMFHRSLYPAKTISHLRAAVACTLLLCLLAPSTFSQQQQTPPVTQEDDVVRVEANLIRLNVGVADRRGRAVTDLRAGDFTVFEDGVKQNVVSFEPASAPFSLVLLLDMSGSTLKFRQTLQQAAVRFLDSLAPEDRVAVVAFNDDVKTLQDFTPDKRKAAFAIIELAKGRGTTRFYDGMRHSLAMLAREGQRRKAVVVLTDGVDTEQRKQDSLASARAETAEQAVAAVKTDDSAPLRVALDLSDRQGVTVYPLALPSGDPKRMLTPPTPQQTAFYTAARARLQTLAERTGGRLHEINRLEDMGRLYAEVAAEMRTLYSIAYQSSQGSRRDGKWRAVNVEVARPELIARTRPGYFAR